jgi:hypothetical protein
METRYTMKLSRLMAIPVAALVLAAGCDRGLTDVNVNPNEPEVVPPQNLLAEALISGVGDAYGVSGLWTGKYLLDLWGQHLAAPTYTDEDRYNPRVAQVAGIWNNAYVNPLPDLQVLKGMAADQQNPNLGAVAETFQQFIFHFITDIYGAIPYSEALQAPDIIAPRYDSQEDVYRGMLAALSAAAGQYNRSITQATFAAGDLIYGGNMEMWYRFNNSLRMRMAMRLTNVLPQFAQEQFVAAYNAGGFQGNADNATLVWSANQPLQNPWHTNFEVLGRRDQVVSAALVDRLIAWNDPRLSVYAQPGSDGQYRGLPNGATPGDVGLPEPAFSKPGPRFTAAQAPSVLMNYAEVLFLQAEAAERGWIAGDAAALYRAAIRASMSQHGIAAAQIDAYLAQPSVAYAGLPSIWTQKWAANYLVGIEAWTEFRRTGYPQLTPAFLSASTQIATRVYYPAEERLYNPANYRDVNQFAPMWWQGN